MDAVTAKKAATIEDVTMDGLISVIEVALGEMESLRGSWIEECSEKRAVVEANFGPESITVTIDRKEGK